MKDEGKKSRKTIIDTSVGKQLQNPSSLPSMAKQPTSWQSNAMFQSGETVRMQPRLRELLSSQFTPGIHVAALTQSQHIAGLQVVCCRCSSTLERGAYSEVSEAIEMLSSVHHGSDNYAVCVYRVDDRRGWRATRHGLQLEEEVVLGQRRFLATGRPGGIEPPRLCFGVASILRLYGLQGLLQSNEHRVGKLAVKCNYPGMSLTFHVNAGANPNYFVVLVEYEDGDGDLSGVDLKEALDSDTWLMAPHGTIVGCSLENQHGSTLKAPFCLKLTGESGNACGQ
ncbi:hypothetical protein Acr_07g0010660 [Actinidia rufa]|uniref:Expansin-like CBD domain-containing protein n=1 Tax=Actinidia rufa TaxID=165716 RepID=A0A7J0EWV2_9ERIC|nr:hypothetical protein Acr_07g0010660 [Actinidia rufa]